MNVRKKAFAAMCIALCSVLPWGCVKRAPAPNETTKSEKTVASTYAESTVIATAESTEKAAASSLGSLSKEETKSLNVFLSNFSEVNLGDYSAENIDNYTFIYFAFSHNKINSSRVKYEGDSEYISFNDANETTNKYFGKELKKQSANEYTFKNDRFYVPAADGESIAYISIATGFFEKDGSIEVPFKVYSYKDLHPDKTEYDKAFPAAYSSTFEEVSKSGDWNFEYDGTAKIKRKTYSGKNTYELIEYKVFK